MKRPLSWYLMTAAIVWLLGDRYDLSFLEWVGLLVLLALAVTIVDIAWGGAVRGWEKGRAEEEGE